MFGWRKRQIANKVDKDINDTVLPEPTVPEVAEPNMIALDNSDAEYTVGVNKAGHTQLRIKLDYGSATLTMHPIAVHKLIRQLKATLDDESND
jgi:hypothetical protein